MRRVPALALLCALLWLSATAEPAQAEPQTFRLAGGQVVFTVMLKGREFPALLDTGATMSLIEVDLAKELGIRSQRVRSGLTAGVFGRNIGYGRTQELSLDFGTGPIRRSIGTYPAGLSFAEENVRILIGMDFLDAMVVSLDFQTMTVDFQRSSAFTAPQKTPLKLTDGGWRRPTLPVILAGTRANLLLDTAASTALHLDSAFIEETPALKALPVTRQRIAGIDGASEQDAIMVPQVTLGGEVFENVRASSASLEHFNRASTDMDGVVGVALLKRFNLVIDFGRYRVWMTPHAGSPSH